MWCQYLIEQEGRVHKKMQYAYSSKENGMNMH